jgi:hypothetical protein
MRTHQIRVFEARESVQDIRHRLFSFPEVLEVFATGRPDVLVVVHTGRPRLGVWLAALRSAGYRTPARRQRERRAEDAVGSARVADRARAGRKRDHLGSPTRWAPAEVRRGSVGG